jgi:hypothetical protein
VQPIKPGVNPANWMLEVTSTEAEKTSGHAFAQLYRESALARAVEATVAEVTRSASRRLGRPRWT